jgi:hypothetical protein
MYKYFPVLLYFLLLVSCKNTPGASTNESSQVSLPPDMQVGGVENFREVKLYIAREENIDTATIRYTILSAYAGAPVGFKLLIKQSGDKKAAFSTAAFLPMGDTSNNFLNALADIYHVKHGRLVFTDSISASCINLHNLLGEEPGNQIAAQNKLIFDSRYDAAELLMNIDKGAHTISFPEKNSDYRNGIINALSK